MLDLSHNGLTGSIPNAIWEHGFSLLDLSFNRLTGTIPENVNEVALNSSLSLQVNQLSGILPKAWVELASIKVLAGNMFTCEHGVGPTINIPKNDPNVNSYQCGSKDTNIALLCFLVLLVMSALVWLWVARVCGVTVDDRLLRENKRAMYNMGWLIVMLCCSMGLYAGLLVRERSYAKQYIWTAGNTGSSGIVLLADVLARSYPCLVLECREEREGARE
jgi:hypothetical protein